MVFVSRLTSGERPAKGIDRVVSKIHVSNSVATARRVDRRVGAVFSIRLGGHRTHASDLFRVPEANRERPSDHRAVAAIHNGAAVKAQPVVDTAIASAVRAAVVEIENASAVADTCEVEHDVSGRISRACTKRCGQDVFLNIVFSE